MPIIAFFGSSKCSRNSEEYMAAEKIADILAEKGFSIVSGGYGGIMEASLKGASKHEVERIAVVSNDLPNRIINDYVNRVIEKPTYMERSLELINIADAYIVFHGGTGTMVELSIIWALKERKIQMNKPIVCFGDQWYEIEQMMSFYSETIIDNSKLIDHCTDIDETVSLILNHFDIVKK